MAAQFPQQNNGGLLKQHAARQQTVPYQTISGPFEAPLSVPHPELAQSLLDIPEQDTALVSVAQKRPTLRIVIIALVGILAVSMYFIWHSVSTQATPAVNTTQQHFSLTTPTVQQTGLALSPVTTTGKIQVYIVGAVKHPGIYILEGNARIYQLLQIAGGPLPEANLVTLNLAARLSDGQEVYVTKIGETPPIVSTSSNTSTTTTAGTSGTSGTKVNINTASANDLRTGLHVSSTTAQAIINYRTQHGPFANIDQLLQVVSQSIYKKIKDGVTLA